MNSATGRRFAPPARRPAPLLMTLLPMTLLATLLTSCTTSVVVEGSLPVPVVASLPVRAGIHFSDDFRSFRYEETLDEGGRVEVDFGRQNTLFFEQLFDALFEETVQLDEPSATNAQVDLLVIPQIDEYGFLSPAISGLNFYAASVHYRVQLLTPAGVPIASWKVVGYGKSPGSAFGGGATPVNKATMIAIRDGGARIATGIRKQADFNRWLEEQGFIRAAATGEE